MNRHKTGARPLKSVNLRLGNCRKVIDFIVVRLAGFEPATFGSGDRRSSPAELQAHTLILFDLRPESNREFLAFGSLI